MEKSNWLRDIEDGSFDELVKDTTFKEKRDIYNEDTKIFKTLYGPLTDRDEFKLVANLRMKGTSAMDQTNVRIPKSLKKEITSKCDANFNVIVVYALTRLNNELDETERQFLVSLLDGS